MQLSHALREPAGSGPFPTLLAFHGFGSNALDILGLAPHLRRGGLLAIAPDGPERVPLGPAEGRAWFPLTGGAPSPAEVARGIAAARDFVEAALERYPIDRSHLGILGFSQGGVVAYALALAAPERYRCLAALSSWLPAELAGAARAGDRSRLSALVQHGIRDEMIAVERGRESAERLRSLGVATRYLEYDMGHEVGPRSLADLDAWLGEVL